MKNIKLGKMKLENFKKVKFQEHDFKQEKAIVFGANESGKSTLINAFIWLFTGKDSDCKNNFDIRERAETGEILNIDFSPCVEVEIFIEDERFVLKRCIIAKRQKYKGVITDNYIDETKCNIDEVPKTVTQFENWIEEKICSLHLIPLLIDCKYFNEKLSPIGTKTKEKGRREWLLETFGNVSDIDIINSNEEELNELKKIIGTKSVADVKKEYAQKKNVDK